MQDDSSPTQKGADGTDHLPAAFPPAGALWRTPPVAPSRVRWWTGHMDGERYLANTSAERREVHDLDREEWECGAHAIIEAGQDRPYRSITEARRDGYRDCPHCLGGRG